MTCISNKWCLFRLSVHQTILKYDEILNSITVLNTENNKVWVCKYILQSYENGIQYENCCNTILKYSFFSVKKVLF